MDNFFHTFYDRSGPDRSRSAYSLYAQNTVGDLLSICLRRVNTCFGNLNGIQGPVTPWSIQQCGLDTALQIHDAIGVRCNENDVDQTCQIIYEAGRIPMEIAGDTLTISMYFKIGKSWGQTEDYDYRG